MEYRQLGRSGLRVSVLTMGTMTFGGRGFFAKAGATDVAGARRLIDRCVDAGINMLDTANAYSGGVSEEIIGEALGDKRHSLLVTTKARMKVGDGPNDAGAARLHVIAECEKSLKRLRTDHIDLYLMHQWDGQTPLEETLSALDRLVRDGKVRYIGCSNYSGWHMMKALGVSERLGLERYVCQQIHYTLEAREAEYELLPIAVDQGVAVQVWSPISGGLLSGKYRRDRKPSGGRHIENWGEPPIRDEARLWNIVDALAEIAEARGTSGAQVALAWLLGRPGVASLVIGAREAAQLDDNIAAASLSLTEEERARLDAVSAPPLLYPYWHQAKTAADRLSPADLALLKPHVKG